MKSRLLLLYVLCMLTGNAFSGNLDRQPNKQKDFFIATHYYGLTEYSWPINYLNSIKDDDVESELKRVKDVGFDTIILLASWSEFEPVVGRADKDVYKKINLIISRPLKKSPADAGVGQYDLKRSANNPDEDDERQPRLPGGDVQLHQP